MCGEEVEDLGTLQVICWNCGTMWTPPRDPAYDEDPYDDR
jgi:hypothetical protein